MKHTLWVTVLLVALFLASHLVGLTILQNYYQPSQTVGGVVVKEAEWGELPYQIERPQLEEDTSFLSIAVFLVIASVLVFVLARFHLQKLWTVWFFLSVWLCLLVAFSAWLADGAAFVVSLGLSFWRVLRKTAVIHNLTEVFLYGGLATIFVPFLSLSGIVILLLLISVYDMIAVWQTKHMVTMAKFQTKMKLFAGLMIPYGGKTAILGGGDVGFPLLLSGVVLKSLGFVPALVVSLFFAVGLLGLLLFSTKGKFYPAMPFLTVAGLIGLAIVLA